MVMLRCTHIRIGCQVTRQGTWLGSVNSTGIFVFSIHGGKICSKSVVVFVLTAGSNAHQEFDDTQEEQYAESFAKR